MTRVGSTPRVYTPKNDKVAEWLRQRIANPLFMSSNLIFVSIIQGQTYLKTMKINFVIR